jgi:hypothetical protein
MAFLKSKARKGLEEGVFVAFLQKSLLEKAMPLIPIRATERFWKAWGLILPPLRL